MCHNLFPELSPSCTSSLCQITFTPAPHLRVLHAALIGPDCTRHGPMGPLGHISDCGQNTWEEVPTSQMLQVLLSPEKQVAGQVITLFKGCLYFPTDT